jgi:tetratricopeptide (TPR) repeat protein
MLILASRPVALNGGEEHDPELSWRKGSFTFICCLPGIVLSSGLPGLGCAPRAQPHGQPPQRPSSESQARAAGTPAGAEPHLGRGYAALKNDRYDEAVAEFRAALAIDPKLALRARFPLAVALFEQQKASDARQEFVAVRAAAGDRPDLAYYLGRLDLMGGDAAGAIQELTRAAVSPPFPDTAYYLGSAHLKAGQLAPAEKWLQTAARITPDDAHVQDRLALLYRQLGRKSESEKAFAKAAELRQKDASTDKLRIDCAQKLEAAPTEEARLVCEQLFDPNDARKLAILGTLYGARGDYEDAVRPFRRAAELDPKSPQMQYNVALAYFRLGRFAEARAALEQVAKLWPDLVQISSLLGACLFKLGDQPQAYQVLSRAHELNPQDPSTANMLFESAMTLAEKSLVSRQYQAAVGYLSEAVKLDPMDPEPHRLLAEVYRATGRDAEAAGEQRQFESLSERGGADQN